MKKRKASFEDFCEWYLPIREYLLRNAMLEDAYTEKSREEFLKEWPLDKILTMSIDDYVIGKGGQNNSFCYELEHGKYKTLFWRIGGDESSKFGIYWNEKQRVIKIKLIKSFLFQSWIIDLQN